MILASNLDAKQREIQNMVIHNTNGTASIATPRTGQIICDTSAIETGQNVNPIEVYNGNQWIGIGDPKYYMYNVDETYYQYIKKSTALYQCRYETRSNNSAAIAIQFYRQGYNVNIKMYISATFASTLFAKSGDEHTLLGTSRSSKVGNTVDDNGNPFYTYSITDLTTIPYGFQPASTQNNIFVLDFVYGGNEFKGWLTLTKTQNSSDAAKNTCEVKISATKYAVGLNQVLSYATMDDFPSLDSVYYVR